MIDNRCRTVILLTHEYPPYVFGGVATYAKQLAEWLSQNGWKVFIIAGRATFNEKVVLERASNNITVIRIYFPEVPPRWFFYALQARKYVEMILNKNQALVLSNNPLTWLTLKNLKKLKNHASFVTVFHGSVYSLLAFFQYSSLKELKEISLEETIYYMQNPLINYLTKRDLITSDRLIFVARHVVKEFKSLYKDLDEKIRKYGTVSYPGIEYDSLVRLRKDVEVEKDKLIVAYVGRMYYTKGVTEVIRTIETSIKEGYSKDIECWLFGRGPLESWLMCYIKKRELSRYVKYYGFVERTKLLNILANYVNVLLHPSFYEGAPVSIMEAQALGIPAITYDLPWAHEFIINGLNGFRVPFGDTIELLEKTFKAKKLNRNRITRFAKRYDRKISFESLKKALEG